MTKICMLQMGLVKEKMTHLVNQQNNVRFCNSCASCYLPKQRNKTEASNNRLLWFEIPPIFFSELTVRVASPSLFKERGF